MTRTILPRGGGEGKATLVKVESASRPGMVHFVSADLMHCSCEHHAITGGLCRHIRQARIRSAKRARVA